MREEVSQFKRVQEHRPPTLKVNSLHLKGRSAMTLPLSPSTRHTPSHWFWLATVLTFGSRGGVGVDVAVAPTSNVKPLRCLHVSSGVIRQPCGAAAERGWGGTSRHDGWMEVISISSTNLFIWRGRTIPTDPPIISQTSSDPVGEPLKPEHLFTPSAR